VRVSESDVMLFKNIPCARISSVPLAVSEQIIVDDAFELFKEFERQGKMKIGRYEDKSPRELEMFDKMIIAYMREKSMQNIPDCSYARFVRGKFPNIWERFLNEVKQ
ncbi:MAG: hypothetical protein K2J80_00260, partial [Oscillospiraceae bacterium]|nr:hypothetical protein [Oscillospiraceae bacterium]